MIITVTSFNKENRRVLSYFNNGFHVFSNMPCLSVHYLGRGKPAIDLFFKLLHPKLTLQLMLSKNCRDNVALF